MVNVPRKHDNPSAENMNKLCVEKGFLMDTFEGLLFIFSSICVQYSIHGNLIFYCTLVH